jgi:hypothetical protein
MADDFAITPETYPEYFGHTPEGQARSAELFRRALASRARTAPTLTAGQAISSRILGALLPSLQGKHGPVERSRAVRALTLAASPADVELAKREIERRKARAREERERALEQAREDERQRQASPEARASRVREAGLAAARSAIQQHPQVPPGVHDAGSRQTFSVARVGGAQ